MISDTSRIATVSLLLVAGILAGTQLGKIAPLVGWYHETVGLSLVTIGWLAALIGFFVAFAALPSAFVIDRFGGFRVFALSSMILFAGGLGVAGFHAAGLILAARLVEGVGYLFLVVVIPTLAAEISPPAFRGPALAVWGGFVPIGFAIADFSARAMVPRAGPETFLWLAILAFGIFALPAGLLLRRMPPKVRAARPEATSEKSAFRSTLSPALFCIAAAFGFYVVLSLAFFTFLPSFGLRKGEALMLAAGAIALVVPLGNIATGAAVGGRGPRFIAVLIAIGFAFSALAAPIFYSADGTSLVTVSAVGFAFFGGVVASALFAAIPFVVPGNGSSAIAIGFIAQSGGIATLIAPPLAGLIVESKGWPALGWLLCLVSLAGLAAIAPLILRPKRASDLLA